MPQINQISNTNQPGKNLYSINTNQKFQRNLNEILEDRNKSKVKSNNFPSNENLQVTEGCHSNLQNSNLHLENLLDHLKTLHSKIEFLTNKGKNNRNIKTTEIISLQNTLLNYTQEIQILSKVMEQLVNGIKTLIQMQV